MSDQLCCPLCGAGIERSDEPRVEQLSRIVHVTDHALRAVLDVGVSECGECDVLNYCGSDQSWPGAWRGARDFVLIEYGNFLNAMVEVAVQIPMLPVGRTGVTATYIEGPAYEPKEMMIAWLDQHAKSFATEV